MQTFTERLVEQKDRPDPIGDLARDFIWDACNVEHLYGVQHIGVQEILQLAEREYFELSTPE